MPSKKRKELIEDFEPEWYILTLYHCTDIQPEWYILTLYHCTDIQPEWYILTLYHCTDILLWSETLEIEMGKNCRMCGRRSLSNRRCERYGASIKHLNEDSLKNDLTINKGKANL